LVGLVSFQAIAIIHPLSCDQPFNLDQIQIKGDHYDVIDNQTMKTDKLFYRIFLSQPDLISELMPDIPSSCEFDYSAPVIKETELRLDGLLTPISDDLNLPLVFLETQMQSDADFYGRFFAGIFLYIRQYKINRPWRGLLILRRRGQDLGSQSPYQFLLDS